MLFPQHDNAMRKVRKETKWNGSSARAPVHQLITPTQDGWLDISIALAKERPTN